MSASLWATSPFRIVVCADVSPNHDNKVRHIIYIKWRDLRAVRRSLVIRETDDGAVRKAVEHQLAALLGADRAETAQVKARGIHQPEPAAHGEAAVLRAGGREGCELRARYGRLDAGLSVNLLRADILQAVIRVILPQLRAARERDRRVGHLNVPFPGGGDIAARGDGRLPFGKPHPDGGDRHHAAQQQRRGTGFLSISHCVNSLHMSYPSVGDSFHDRSAV